MRKFVLSIFILGVLFNFTACSSDSSSQSTNNVNTQSSNAMPLSYNNITDFVEKQNAANNSKPLGMSQKEALNYLYIDIMNDMGYDFEATLLESAKVLSTTKSMSKAFYLVRNLFKPLIEMLAKSENLISDNTRNKLAQYVKYRYIDNNFVKALNLIKYCQEINSYECTKKDFYDVLSMEKFINVDEIRTRATDKKNFTNGAAAMLFIRKIGDSDNLPKINKYTISINGNNKGIFHFFDEGEDAKIELNDAGMSLIKDYPNNPWWLN